MWGASLAQRAESLCLKTYAKPSIKALPVTYVGVHPTDKEGSADAGPSPALVRSFSAAADRLHDGSGEVGPPPALVRSFRDASEAVPYTPKRTYSLLTPDGAWFPSLTYEEYLDYRRRHGERGIEQPQPAGRSSARRTPSYPPPIPLLPRPAVPVPVPEPTRPQASASGREVQLLPANGDEATLTKAEFHSLQIPQDEDAKKGTSPFYPNNVIRWQVNGNTIVAYLD